jgi:putative transposase
LILAHKIALDPTQEQAVYFAKACGTARFAWNWALARWRQEYALWKEYRCGPKPSEMSLRRDLNALKADAFPWMLEVTKNAPQQAIKNVGTAFKNFFEGRAKFPTFKKKGVSSDSFRADPGTDKIHPNAVEIDGKRVKLPVIGWIKMREPVRFAGNIKSATVSRVADRWFVSLTVEVDHTPPVRENQAVGGVDLGIKALATLSDGSTIEGPKALRKNLKKLRRKSRALSRKVKGSANRRKAATKLARLHARIANIRKDALHKATTEIVQRFDVVGIEDLNVRGMMALGTLSRAVADVGMFEFRRQLEYKAVMHGVRIVVADRWYPSSRTCSDCGHLHAGLSLAEREWTCDGCGVVHDRDHNAAINLMNMAGSSSVTACGAEGAGHGRKTKAKPAAVKQGT